MFAFDILTEKSVSSVCFVVRIKMTAYIFDGCWALLLYFDKLYFAYFGA